MDRDFGMDVFVDLRGIDLDVDHFGLFGVTGQAAGNPVIKAHADGDQDIAFILFEIRAIIAVHAQHAHMQRVRGGQG